MNNPETTRTTKDHLEKLLSIMGIAATIAESPADDSSVIYRIDCGEIDAGALIGKHGQSLDALQFLLRQLSKSAQPEEQESRFILDVLDYRNRRKDQILDKAKSGAVAILNGEIEQFVLPPMSPYERRLVHNYLHENFPELASHSEGKDEDRHVILSFGGATAAHEAEGS